MSPPTSPWPMTILPLLHPIKCHWVAMSCSYGKGTNQEVLVRQLSVKVQIPSSSLQKIKFLWVERGLSRLSSPQREEQLLAMLPIRSSDTNAAPSSCALPSGMDCWVFHGSASYLGPRERWERAVSIPIRDSLNSVNKNIYQEDTLGDTL